MKGVAQMINDLVFEQLKKDINRNWDLTLPQLRLIVEEHNYVKELLNNSSFLDMDR